MDRAFSMFMFTYAFLASLFVSELSKKIKRSVYEQLCLLLVSRIPSLLFLSFFSLGSFSSKVCGQVTVDLCRTRNKRNAIFFWPPIGVESLSDIF